MKVKNTLRRRVSRGFTLLEMVIVLGIIAMILGGAIFAMRGIGDAAKLRQVEADIKAYENALQMYKLNAGHFPTTAQGLASLKNKPTSTPVPKRWVQIMKDLVKDPWGNEYGYKYPGSKNTNEFEIISRGPDGIEGNDDDISSQD